MEKHHKNLLLQFLWPCGNGKSIIYWNVNSYEPSWKSFRVVDLVATVQTPKVKKGDVLKGTNTSARMDTRARAKVTKESDHEQLKEKTLPESDIKPVDRCVRSYKFVRSKNLVFPTKPLQINVTKKLSKLYQLTISEEIDLDVFLKEFKDAIVELAKIGIKINDEKII